MTGMQTAFSARSIFGEVISGTYAVNGVEWKVDKTGLHMVSGRGFEDFISAKASSSCKINGQRFAVTALGRILHPGWLPTAVADRVSLAVGREEEAAYWIFGCRGDSGEVIDILGNPDTDPRMDEIAACGLAAIAAARAARRTADDLKASVSAAKDSVRRAQQEAERQARISAGLDRIRK
jgi:hypothetical protein